MIVLRALGTAEIDTGLKTLTPSQEIVFAAGLYLILERGKRLSRSRLATLLWPRATEKVRAHRLRQTLLQLKKLGFLVQADRDIVQVPRADARSDVDTIATDNSQTLLKHESLEFLPGYQPRVSEEFRDWLDSHRTFVNASITNALVREIERARHRADWTEVDRLSAQCLSLDPYNETAVLAAAESVAMRGEKRKAVALLDRFISDVGGVKNELHLPATLLRRRVLERLPERPPMSDSDPPFVGREVEMELLSEAVDLAKSGHGSSTLLIGEAGIGKSRLCEEIAAFAALQGVRLQHLRCRPSDLDRPLSVFVDMVPQLCELPGALGCTPQTFNSLKKLTEVDLRSADSGHLKDSEISFESVRTGLFDLLDSVVEEVCLLIIIEDVQWLDEPSAKIIARMVESAAKKQLMFILNSRPGKPSLSRYVDTSLLQTRNLGPLPPASALTLVRSIASSSGSEADDNFINWGLSVADGNPFFLQELARQWIETGQTHEAPPSVARVLAERLARLTEEALRVLQCCVVLGEHATLERVEKVLEFQAHQLLSAVDELSKAAMLRLVDGTFARNGQIQSRHDLLSSAATNGLSAIALSFIHRRAAEILESEIAEETMPTTLLWACAAHRHHAGDRERALTLSISCAEHLLDLGLSSDAVAAFERSLDYCTSDDERLRVLPRYAFALQMASQWEESKGVLRTCDVLFRKTERSPIQHSEFELLLLEARHQSSFDYATLLVDTIPCVESSDASPAHRIRAAVMALKIATDIGPAEMIDSLYSHVAPLLHDEDLSESNRLEVEIIYSTLRGNTLIPVERLDRLAESARTSGGELAHFNALMTAASACRLSARYSEALHFVNRAFQHAIENKFLNRLGQTVLAAVRVHVAASVFDKADIALRDMTKYPLPAGDKLSRIEILFLDTRLAIELGDLSRARGSFAAIEQVPSTYSSGRRAYYFALGIHVLLQGKADREEIEPLVRSLEQAHARIRGIGGKDFESYALYIGLCALGEEARADEMLTSYVLEHRRSKWPLPVKIEAVLKSEAQATHVLSPRYADDANLLR